MTSLHQPLALYTGNENITAISSLLKIYIAYFTYTFYFVNKFIRRKIYIWYNIQDLGGR